MLKSLAQREADRLQGALRKLTERIKAGDEFPDACGAVASRQGVNYEKLRMLYDEWCEEGCKPF